MNYEQESKASFFWGFIFCCLFILGFAFCMTYQHAYQEGIDETKSEMHCQPIPTVKTMGEAKKRINEHKYGWLQYLDGAPVDLTEAE